MEQKSPAVNTRRRYDSSGRRERARQTRDADHRRRRELFLADGYAATTVAAIAAAARVSVETIYKGFGGKPGLVRAIVEKGLAGEGPVPAEQQSDHIRDTEPDPRRILAAWGAFTAQIAPRVAPVLTLARDAAASDPEVAAHPRPDQRRPPGADDHQRPRPLRAPATSGPASHPTKPPTLSGRTARPSSTNCSSSAADGQPNATAEFVAQALIAALLPARTAEPTPPARR